MQCTVRVRVVFGYPSVSVRSAFGNVRRTPKDNRTLTEGRPKADRRNSKNEWRVNKTLNIRNDLAEVRNLTIFAAEIRTLRYG